MAEKLGVTNRSISRWENGKTMPDILLFEPLCNALNITVNELIQGEKMIEEQVVGFADSNILDYGKYLRNKEKKSAFIKGFFLVLCIVAAMVSGFVAIHWFSTVAEEDSVALAKQAAEYLGYDELLVNKVEKRGDYLAVLCTDKDGNRSMCVFERDSLFEKRWHASGGKTRLKLGNIHSWNYGSPQGEAVLIFCGVDIPKNICWYKFQNSDITYTCPVEDRNVLDMFIISDRNDINGYAIPLDINQQLIEE